jgi:hypothetical protein
MSRPTSLPFRSAGSLFDNRIGDGSERILTQTFVSLAPTLFMRLRVNSPLDQFKPLTGPLSRLGKGQFASPALEMPTAREARAGNKRSLHHLAA